MGERLNLVELRIPVDTCGGGGGVTTPGVVSWGRGREGRSGGMEGVGERGREGKGQGVRTTWQLTSGNETLCQQL